ncbi:MAG: pyridoxamine 5'-phosphate oxidase family protein [Clostridiales bacterium]|jgi:general stress protein 26|nr:pyridoxamine 5'-phosphate oxidase family protein [Clostridiales bacterium]
MNLDYAALTEEIEKILENTQTITLATCSDYKVTARSMAIINDGVNILFQTSGLSEKIKQLTENHNVAFSVGNIQIEAVAHITKNPKEIRSFIEKYKVKYPQYFSTYSGMPDEVTVVCEPVKFALYKFIDGKPCTDILDVSKTLAYREVLD